MTENNNAIETREEPEVPASQTVVGIRFRSCGKIYTFDVDDIEVTPGTKVVVDSEMGLSLGRVVTSKQIIEKTREPLKKVLRVATEEDYEIINKNRTLEEEARAFCIEKVSAMNLPMKIVSTETTLDTKRLIFYFTADGRIDFRELVRDLASKFKTRIEMRQIGVRDEVKLLGGFGCCGRQTCCSLFLTSFAPVTIKMAKEQDLSINQSKLSGVCGRLMCCLGYEHREQSKDRTGHPFKGKQYSRKPESKPAGGKTEIKPADKAEIPAGDSAQPVEKSGPGTDHPEKTHDKQGDEKKRFRRNRKRRSRHKGEKTPAETAPVKQPQDPDKKDEKSESKNKGRHSQKRKRFWKKKKPKKDDN